MFDPVRWSAPRLKLLAVATWLAFAACIPAAQQPPPTSAPAVQSAAVLRYKPAAKHSVGLIARLDLADAVRDGRKTPLLIRFPLPAPDDSPHHRPLVIFSHGAGGSGNSFAELSEHWAAHGYIVVHPTHSDSLRLRRERGEQVGDLRDAFREVVSKVDIFDRQADVQLILKSFDEIDAAIGRAVDQAGGASRAAPRIDPEHIALAGHSAGAMTTQMLAGVRFQRAGRAVTFAEPRIDAFIVISGQGRSRPAFNEESWSDIRKPMLVIAGSADVTPVSDETPAGRRDPYELAPPGDKYLLYIEGATHGSYAGKLVTRVLGEKAPENIDYITELVADSTLAFLDRYLSDDRAARSYLESSALDTRPGGEADYQRK